MIAEHCPLSSLNHVTVDTLCFSWNADNGGALKCALRDIAKSHVKLKSITRVTIEYCHEQDYVFIFIQRVPGVSVYTECCSVATSKTICWKMYGVLQECQCRQSVGELPLARKCVYLYTVFHVCHEYTECCNVATSKTICLSIYRVFQEYQCRQSIAVLPRARICVYVYTECSMIAMPECCSVAMSKIVFTYVQRDPILPWIYRVLTYFHEQDYVLMCSAIVVHIQCNRQF